MNKSKKCVKGFPCGNACISRTKQCWANLSSSEGRMAETFSQFVNRLVGIGNDKESSLGNNIPNTSPKPTSLFDAKLKKEDIVGATDQAILESEITDNKARIELAQNEWELRGKAEEALKKNQPIGGENEKAEKDVIEAFGSKNPNSLKPNETNGVFPEGLNQAEKIAGIELVKGMAQAINYTPYDDTEIAQKFPELGIVADNLLKSDKLPSYSPENMEKIKDNFPKKGGFRDDGMLVLENPRNIRKLEYFQNLLESGDEYSGDIVVANSLEKFGGQFTTLIKPKKDSEGKIIDSLTSEFNFNGRVGFPTSSKFKVEKIENGVVYLIEV